MQVTPLQQNGWRFSPGHKEIIILALGRAPSARENGEEGLEDMEGSNKVNGGDDDGELGSMRKKSLVSSGKRAVLMLGCSSLKLRKSGAAMLSSLNWELGKRSLSSFVYPSLGGGDAERSKKNG